MHVITANHVSKGTVIFLREDGDWSDNIASAWRLDGKSLDSGLQMANKAAQDGVAVGPYEVAITETAGMISPTKLRERMRLTGPSVETRERQGVSDKGFSVPMPREERFHVSL